MEYKKYFDQILKKRYADEYEQMIMELDNVYNSISKDTQFAFTSSNPLDKRMDFSAYFLALLIAICST